MYIVLDKTRGLYVVRQLDWQHLTCHSRWMHRVFSTAVRAAPPALTACIQVFRREKVIWRLIWEVLENGIRSVCPTTEYRLNCPSSPGHLCGISGLGPQVCFSSLRQPGRFHEGSHKRTQSSLWGSDEGGLVPGKHSAPFPHSLPPEHDYVLFMLQLDERTGG